MELRVSSFGSRAELEKYCELLEPDQKEGLSIVGTIEELARFQLGYGESVHGIPCIADDFTGFDTLIKASEVPDRIKSNGYGLNGRLTELK